VKIVDGATGVLGSVGDPIMQVRNPEVWSALFRANGVNALCIPFHVSPGELPTFFAGLRTVQNLLGLIFTKPHKPGRGWLELTAIRLALSSGSDGRKPRTSA
jgi:shikimate dehydrogenase